MNFFSKTALLAAMCLTTGTLAAQTTIGYSNGYINRTQGKRFGMGQKQGVAIRISKEKAQMLKGMHIESFEAAHSTSHTQNLTFFISTDLSKEPVYFQVEKKSSTRWKKYQLDTPYTITGEEFYIGYTCEVADTYKPHIFDESKDLGNALAWAFNDGKWEDISTIGFGAPSIRFQLSEDKNFTDALLKPVTASGFLKVGNAYTFGGQLLNFGSEPIRSFDLVCQMGNAEAAVYPISDVHIASGETYDFTMPEYTPKENGDIPFQVTIQNVNQQEDSDKTDNLSVSSTYIYPNDVEQKVLIEGFTGQACSNCPNGHKALKEELAGVEDQFIEISHHSGYQVDAFTMKEDMDYTWFYNNNGSTYAPAVMFNRSRVADNLPAVVFETQDRELLRAAIQKFTNVQPYVSVSLDNQYDEATRNNHLTVKVYTHVAPSAEQHRLNLCLTQNNIQSYQSGASSSYIHDHVFRGSLNGTWGEDIELIPGETVVKTYDYTLPETIVSSASNAQIATRPEDMNIIAFVSDATTSALTCKVYNAASIKMTDNESTGITTLQNQSATLTVMNHQLLVKGQFATVNVYNTIGQLSGQLKNEGTLDLDCGFYIVTITYADGHQESHKIYIAH